MKVSKYLTALLLILVSCMDSLTAQNNYENAVVKINSGKNVGTGLIIGEDSQGESIYVASSLEMIRNTKEPEITLKNGTSLTAKVSSIHETKEIVLFSLPKPKGFISPQLIQAFKNEYRSTDIVKIILPNIGQGWKVASGNRILNVGNTFFSCENSDISSGFWGGLVLSNMDHCMGIVTRMDEKGNPRIIKIDSISKIISGKNIHPTVKKIQPIVLKKLKYSKAENIVLRIIDKTLIRDKKNVRITLLKSREELDYIQKIDFIPDTTDFAVSFTADKISPSSKYSISFEVEDMNFESPRFKIGKPFLKKAIGIGVVAIATALTLWIRKPINDPPDPSER